MKPERVSCIAALALAGCQANNAPPAASQALASTSSVEQTADAIARGEAAERSGSAADLAVAALALERLGARANEGTPDVAARWRAAAVAGNGQMPPPFRGRALGPAYSRGAIDANGAFVTEQVFLAGQPAEIAIVPQAQRRLRVVVVDQDDRILCDQNVAPPRAVCRWLPIFTRRVTIRLHNPRADAVNYYLVTN